MSIDLEAEKVSKAKTASPARNFSSLVGENANLIIHDFNIHKRTTMNTCNRSLPYYIMSYMQEGSSVLRCKHGTFDVKKGEVVIVPPNTTHDHIMSRGGRSVFLWWHFDLTIGDKLDVLRFVNRPMVFPVEDSAHFEAEFLLYTKLQLRPDNTLSAHIMRRAKALELLAYLFENASIFNYINDRFGDVPDDFISMLHDVVADPASFRRVNELADRYGYHSSYVTSRFRHFFGVTPSKLGRHLLYAKAQVLIRSRNISLEDVAAELGFSEPSSFTRFFKSMEGMSPSSLRRQELDDSVDD